MKADILERLLNWRTVYPEESGEGHDRDGALFQAAYKEIAMLRAEVLILRDLAGVDSRGPANADNPPRGFR